MARLIEGAFSEDGAPMCDRYFVAVTVYRENPDKPGSFQIVGYMGPVDRVGSRDEAISEAIEQARVGHPASEGWILHVQALKADCSPVEMG